MGSSTALVTGAGTRLGSIFARHLASLGYDLALHCNSSEKGANQLAEELNGKGNDCAVFRQDFAEPFDTEQFIDSIRDRFSNLDCMVNNASAYVAASAKSTSREMLETQFRVNFTTPFLLAAGFANKIDKGQIINILDNKIAYQQYQYSAYLLSKKALADFTKMAALEFAPDIRVNGIAPGVTLPGESRNNEYIKWRIEGIPLEKKGSDSNLIAALDYVLQNDFVTGQILYVDGGESLNHVGRNYENYSDTK